MRGGAKVRGAAFACQPNLTLPFGKTSPPLTIGSVVAMVTADPGQIVPMFQILRRQRHTAGMADGMTTRLQVMIDRDPVVEDETFTLPTAVLARDILQIAQDAPFQMVDLLKAEIPHQGAGLLTADSAGTEHGQLFRAFIPRRGKPFGPGREITEAVRLRINGAGKTADGCFIPVAGVDHHDIRIINQRVPVGRLDIGAGAPRRLNLWPSHGDDLTLQPNLHAQKGLLGRGGEFQRQPIKTLLRPDPVKKSGHAVLRPADGAVDPFLGEKQRTLNVMKIALRLNMRPQFAKIGEVDKLVQRGDDKTRLAFNTKPAKRVPHLVCKTDHGQGMM